MAAETESGKCMDQAQNDRSRTLAARRLLLKGGLGAAPIAMTLASAPVMASQTTTTSLGASGLASTKSQGLVTVTGLSPTTWSGTSVGSANWPTTCKVQGTGGTWSSVKFAAIFGSNSVFPTQTLKQVLADTTADGPSQKALARNLVAAILNVRSGRMMSGGNAILPESTVIRMWNECQGGNFYPISGNSSVTWGIYSPTNSLMTYGGGGVIGYLRTTWT